MVLREAELYQSLHRGNPGDADFYARSCEGAHRVLELGSGYGRIALGLGALGHCVTGLELDAGLLALSRAELAKRADLGQRVRLLLGDMRGFALDQQFDRVIVPYSGLYCLLSDRELEACLRAAHRHLTPGGQLCFDVYYADAFHAESEPDDVPSDQVEPVVSIVHDGELLSVYERSEWDKPAQRIDVVYDYRDASGEVVHTAVVRQRYLLFQQTKALLGAAGFTDFETHADFAEGEPGAATDSVAWVARKLTRRAR